MPKLKKKNWKCEKYKTNTKLKKRIKNKLINKRIYIIYKNYIEYNRSL